MKFKSQVYTEAAGSIGGITYSHNRGGMYTRCRAIPTNPATEFQQAVRGYVAQLTSLWQNTLTVGQRVAWDAYAELVPLPDKLGEPRNVGGLGMYVRCNVPRLQAGEPRVDDGPTDYTLGDYTPPNLGNATEAAQTADLTFTTTDDWANEDDAAMLVYLSRGLSPAINFFKGPYRYAHKIEGDGITPPTSPATITVPFAITEGQKLFARVQVTRADGRLSSPFRDLVLVVA